MKKEFILIYMMLICMSLSGCQFNSNPPASNNSSVQSNRTSPSSLNSYPNSNLTPSNNVTENTLYEFSTEIKSKSSNRLNNISITCNTLNETIVEPNAEFSFCDTIRKSYRR